MAKRGNEEMSPAVRQPEGPFRRYGDQGMEADGLLSEPRLGSPTFAGGSNPISPSMTLRALLRLRPLAIGTLEKRAPGFWDSLDHDLGYAARDASPGNLLEELSRLRIPDPATDWSAMPLYHLVDHLTGIHRGLQSGELADLNHILDLHTLADSGESESLKEIQRAFQAFSKEFERHVDEEETYLYPKVLRYEACLRDNRVHPEFHRGSLQTYIVMRMRQDGERLFRCCLGVETKLRAHLEAHPESFAGGQLLDLMRSFRTHFDEHAFLESQVLIPLAREMEKRLYNASIRGKSALS